MRLLYFGQSDAVLEIEDTPQGQIAPSVKFSCWESEHAPGRSFGTMAEHQLGVNQQSSANV